MLVMMFLLSLFFLFFLHHWPSPVIISLLAHCPITTTVKELYPGRLSPLGLLLSLFCVIALLLWTIYIMDLVSVMKSTWWIIIFIAWYLLY